MSTQDKKPGAPVDVPSDRDQVVHEYDGIQEYDNRLPNWWLYTLFGTIVFAGWYWLHFETFKIGASPDAAYRAEVAAAEAEKAKTAVTPDQLVALAKDGAVVKAGQEVFMSTCVACHGPNAGGTIGPNLTDAFWLHGGAPDKIYGTVRDGFAAKGMPAWGPQLGEQKIRSVVAYVLTLRNTNVAGGKPPQGEKED
jgi:cytochrome c oxidase cbb3-type subunit 3